MPEQIVREPGQSTSAKLRPSALIEVMLRACDNHPDPRAILGIVRDGSGEVVDLRIHYGNAAYWQLSGFRPEHIGRTISDVVPALDWTVGVAARFMALARSGGTAIDRNVRTTPQVGPFSGQERVFEVEITATREAIAAGFRDITEDVAARERQTAEARRSAAVARFLATAIDPAVSGDRIMAALADELAATIGDLVVVVKAGEGGAFDVLAASGGPGDVAERIRADRVGRPIVVAPWTAASPDGGPIVERDTVHLQTVTDDIRAFLTTSFRALGLPPDLARTVTSHVSTPIRGTAGALGRVVLERFADDPPYTADDVETIETIAAAAALVFERQTAAGRLISSLARFEAFFQQAPTPKVALDANGGVQFNEAALVLFGRSREEMEAFSFRPDAPWIPADQAAEWAALRDRARRGDWTATTRATIQRPTGERRHVDFSGIPLMVDGRIDGVIAVMNDVTDRELLEAQLRHAQKMEALGRLAGGIAHDFNNILMGILGFGEFIAADARASRVSVDDADQIVAATRRAIDLTARLTTFARRDASVLERTELASLIEGMLPLIRRLIPESIAVVTDLEPGCEVVVDRVEFEQILVNLVVNAVDAMPEGGRLTVEARADVADAGGPGPGDAPVLSGQRKRAVLIAVSDTGVGMDEATRLRVFEPFFTTKGVGVGTGLGLSMVYAAVERAGGRIWVYSEPGRGSTFRIYLPPAAAEDAETGDGEPSPAEVRGGTESILLLEDDDLVRDIVARTLRDLGYGVAEASRPSEALALAERRRFDLLISDVVMPEMSGDAVAKQLRARWPDLPVVFMSGYTARALDFHPSTRDALIHKPIAPSELGAAIRAALDR